MSEATERRRFRVEPLPLALPDEVNPRRLRRRTAAVGAMLIVLVLIALLAPGLGEVRDRLGDVAPGWLALAVALEALSCVSYVLMFRPVFCARMSWRSSWEIGLSELAVGSVVPASGAGGLALGAWVLHQGGMPGHQIARRSVAFFLIKSSVNFAAVAVIGLVDDVWGGRERGFRQHLRARRTTGVLKLLGIPAIGLAATRSVSGAVLVAASANALNLLDTRPGRALKAFLLGTLVLRGATLPYAAAAVVLAPYDLREMAMLGDAGSNALGAVLAFGSVDRLAGRGRLVAIGGLAALTAVGEFRSLGATIERTPGLAALDRLGRLAR